MTYLKLAVATMCATALLVVPAGARTISGSSTAYHTCDGSSASTAGHPSGVAWGRVASHGIRYGTWIKMIHPRTVGGRRYFVVNDTGGPGFVVDFYAKSCGWMNSWGRRWIKFRTLSHRDLWHGLPRGGWARRKPWQHPHWAA